MTVNFPPSQPVNGASRPTPAGRTGPLNPAQVPAAPVPETAAPARPVATTDTGSYAATPVTGDLSFPDGKGLAVGGATAPHSLTAGIDHLRQTLELTLRQQKPPLSEAQRTSIDDALGHLDVFLRSQPDFGKAENRTALREQLQQLAGRLQDAGVCTPQVRANLNEVVVGSIEAMGKSVKLPLQTSSSGSRLAGLVAPTMTLNPLQRGAVADAGSLLRAVNSWDVLPGKLSPEKLIALGLRDKLLSLAQEMLLPPPSEVKAAPSKYQDQILLLNGVEMLDKMLKSEPIPADLLNDMSKVVQTAADQGGKGLQQAFDTLAKSGGQLQQAGTQLNSASSNMQSLLSALAGGAKSGAPNLVKGFDSVIKNYASASSSATSSLPKLPFPITMPVPIKLGSPPNQLNIPAGSTLSYNSSTKNYNINSPGLAFGAGGTQIQATNANIQLGPTLDKLNINSLSVTSGGTSIQSTGNTIQIDKVQNSSLMQAQNVNVDWGSGKVTMSQVSLVSNPNMVQLGAQNLAYADKSTTISASGVQLGQTINNGVTTTGGSGSNVNVANGGTLIQAGQLSFNMVQDANAGTSAISFIGQDVHVTSGKDKIDVGSGVLNIANNADGSSVTSLTANNGSWVNGNQTLTTSAIGFQINQDPSGQIQSINALAQSLNYTDGKQKIGVSNGSLNALYGPNGQISQVNAAAGMLGWSKDNQNLLANGVTGQINYGPNGQPSQLLAGASNVSYADGKSLLYATNGKLQVDYDANGQLKDAQVSGDNLLYNSVGGNGKPLNLSLGQFSGQITPNGAGGQDLNFNADNLKVTADKTSAAIPEVRNLLVSTNSSGQVDKLHVELPATSTVNTDGLNAALKNVSVDYQQKVLTATADQLSGTLAKPDLTGTFTLNGAKLIDNSQFTSLHLDSSKIDLTQLKDQYKLDIKNIDLVLDKTAAGQLSGGQLRFEDLQGALKGYTITGTNEQGKQMVMSFGLSEDGKMLQRLGFEIPKGGQLSVNKGDDWFLKLGGDQRFGMNYDAKSNVYNFTAENLNAQYVNKDLQLDVSGLRGNKANLDVSLTPDKGLVINDISNLSGKVTLKQGKGLAPIEIDIDKIKGFYLKQTNISGGSQGMMLHLAPTGPDSTMTASIRTAYNGIPLGVSFKDVHELKVGGQISTNNARVYIGDPSGRGQIEIQAGPLKLKGSEIDIQAKYHMFDTQRMLSSLDKLNSNNNIQLLGPYLGVDPIKGKATLDTGNSRGVYGQFNLLFPSPVGAALRASGAPDYLQQMAGLNGIRDEGAGFTLGSGYRWHTGSGAQNQLGFDLGLLPGSYFSIDQHKGSMSLGGVPLPKHMTLGTTPYAGLNFKQTTDTHTLGVQAGVFANPAAFAPESAQQYIYEDPRAKFGATVGVKYQSQSGAFLGASYIGTGNQPNQFFQGPSAQDSKQGWNHQFNLSAGFVF